MGKIKKTQDAIEDEYIIFIELCEILDKYYCINEEKYLRRLGRYRNPLTNDNINSLTSTKLLYKIPGAKYLYKKEGWVKGMKKETDPTDHLIGMKNIVHYLYLLYKVGKINNCLDYYHSLKALQILIVCPTKLNNDPRYKDDFVCNSTNYGIIIQWNVKLKMNGITELEHIKTGEMVSVDVIYTDWYNENRQYLL